MKQKVWKTVVVTTTSADLAIELQKLSDAGWEILTVFAAFAAFHIVAWSTAE
jgi:hypothetical protein